MNQYLKWWRIAIWAGVLINQVQVVPSVISPAWLVAIFRFPPLRQDHSIWIFIVGVQLFLLSVMYVPVGLDPFRYRVNSWVAVIARLTFGSIWYWQFFVLQGPRAFLLWGTTDLTLGIVFLILWLQLLKREHS